MGKTKELLEETACPCGQQFMSRCNQYTCDKEINGIEENTIESITYWMQRAADNHKNK